MRKEHIKDVFATKERFIEIIDSPIRRVNIVEEEIYGGGWLCRNIYVVPDQNVSTKGGYRYIESAPVIKGPLFGRIIDVRWESELKDYPFFKILPY